MSISCSSLCCAIKKACRMLYPSESTETKILDFLLDKWAEEDCPELLTFNENAFIENMFAENVFDNDYEYSTERLSDFFHEMDLCVEQESDDHTEVSSAFFFMSYLFTDTGSGYHLYTFRMPDKKFCGLTDFVGRPTVSMRRRDIEVRIEVYD